MRILPLLMLLPVVASAQWRALAPGDRVRVGDPAQLTGVLLGVYPNQLRIGTEASMVAVPWERVSALSVSEKRTRRQGALHKGKWGLAVGGVLGIIVLAGPEDEEFGRGELAAWALGESVFFGALIGGIWPGRQWRKLDVAATRAASRLTASTPAPEPTGPTIVATQDADVSRAGETPRLEVTIGAGSTEGTGNHGQFPALAVSLAANLGFSPRTGAALVGDATAALFTSALMAGPKLYARTAPLHSRRRVATVFGQLLAGKMRAETSGVVHSTGGFAWQPGVGIEYGGGSRAARLQIDYAIVRDGYVYDDRVTSGPVNDLTGTRVLIGFGWRPSLW